MKQTTLLIPATIAFAINTYAQKLPNVQQASLRAPANVKIDGKADEWGGALQAYNKSVDVFYSMANNDSNLCLVIKATDKQTIYKIINGGISLSIAPAGKREEAAKTITYPKFDRNNYPSVNLDNRPSLKKVCPLVACSWTHLETR